MTVFLIIICVVGGIFLLAGAGLFQLFFPLVRGVHLLSLNSGIGASASDFEIRGQNGIPYLWINNLPYQTHFEETTRRSRKLDGDWFIRFDHDEQGRKHSWHTLRSFSGWKTIQVPSTFNNADGTHTTYDGTVWYAHTFKLTKPKDAERLLRLTFQGVLIRSEIWLNRECPAEREGGYTPFSFDITGKLDYKKENVLIVKVDNRLTASSLPPKTWPYHHPGWHAYGGVYRSVSIEFLPKPYIFKAAAVSKMDASSAQMHIDVLLHTESDSTQYGMICTVKNEAGRVIAKKTLKASADSNVCAHGFDLDIKNASVWSHEKPVLYTVTVSLETKDSSDEIMFKTGICSVEVKGESLCINGKPVFLKGICKHEDDPLLGATQTTKSILRDLSHIKQLNANYIRLTHYPHESEEMITARNQGFYLSEEIANYQAGTGFTAWFAEQSSLSRFPVRYFGLRQMMLKRYLLNAQREIAEMIERDRNNPAIIMWSVGNETYDLFATGGLVYKWLRDVVRVFDTTRPVTMAEITYNVPAFDNNRCAAKYMDVISINMYFGWYYKTTADAAPHLDKLHARFPGKPVIVSEFGADAAPGRRESDGIWKSERVAYGKTYSEDYQAHVIADYWKAVSERPYIIGMSPWVFSDFYCTWFPSNPVPCFNLKGLVSKDRKPKIAYHVLQKLYIGRTK